MAIKELQHGIKLMKWRRNLNGNPAWIFAKAWTVRGYVILRIRGYIPHLTVFGNVLRKDLRPNPASLDVIFAACNRAKQKLDHNAEWISTNVLTPKDLDQVDILINAQRRVCDAAFYQGYFYVQNPQGEQVKVTNTVTHWMLVPELPRRA